MPSIKKTGYAKDYIDSRESGSAVMREYRDCAVVAASIATGLPYQTVHGEMAKLGRKSRRGTPRWITLKVVREAGFKLIREDLKAVIERFPKPHCEVLKNFTTHHPRRFPGCIDPTKTYLAFTLDHVLAITNGVVQDWSVNSSLRVTELYSVEPNN